MSVLLHDITPVGAGERGGPGSGVLCCPARNGPALPADAPASAAADAYAIACAAVSADAYADANACALAAAAAPATVF